jgi:hypothetical protein
MRKNFFAGLIIAFSIFGLFLPVTYAAAISGTLSYAGEQTGALLLLSLPNPAYLQRPNNEEPANP